MDISTDITASGDTSNYDAVVIGVDVWILGFVGWVGHGCSAQSIERLQR